MHNTKNISILLKKLIKSRFNSLSDLAKIMKIDRTTLGRNLQKPTRKFLIRLTEAGVPVPDHLINPVVDSVKVFISEDGVEGLIVKENI